MHRNKWLAIAATTMLWSCLLAACDYARMTTDEAYDTYETRLPAMPTQSVASSPGETALRIMGPESLQNPLQPDNPILARGFESYGNFCVHCHGPKGTGKATVGQSFAPLPTDLTSPNVLDQSDGALFYKIGFGFKRHPPLIHTMSERAIWSVILYMRDLGKETGKR